MSTPSVLSTPMSSTKPLLSSRKSVFKSSTQFLLTTSIPVLMDSSMISVPMSSTQSVLTTP
eukprot:4061736-Amphidinium_carterae.1